MSSGQEIDREFRVVSATVLGTVGFVLLLHHPCFVLATSHARRVDADALPSSARTALSARVRAGECMHAAQPIQPGATTPSIRPRTRHLTRASHHARTSTSLLCALARIHIASADIRRRTDVRRQFYNRLLHRTCSLPGRAFDLVLSFGACLARPRPGPDINVTTSNGDAPMHCTGRPPGSQGPIERLASGAAARPHMDARAPRHVAPGVHGDSRAHATRHGGVAS
jgi:hypothetical protein